MTLDHKTLGVLEKALRRLDSGFDMLPSFTHDLDTEKIGEILSETAERMHDNFPYQHPFYIGQMLKPPHPVARLAYALSLWLNPNNHALDGGRASSRLEKEAVARIAAMFGWEQHLGHLTGGGTMANLEALWVSRELQGNGTVLASAQAHYTHERLCKVLGIPFRAIPVDRQGRIDINALEDELKRGDVATVVATLGTTALGAVDPLDEILTLRDKHRFRLHVDAAYGGYFTLVSNLDDQARRAFDTIGAADSIVVDPHKHGLQPYGCGCILFRDPAVGSVYKHDSPYTYFSSDELHLGEISLECSRPGAAAVALWATQEMFPYEQGGQFARDLETCRATALRFHDWLADHPGFVPLLAPQLDIVVWAVRAKSATDASHAARRIFDEAAKHDLHLALAEMPRVIASAALPDLHWDRDTITCL
ncbi:MAG TPA: aminotransferase class V-fold PLP-dependent enzyme, partial [Acidobacteriota bacterium]|nr:aminotransferase class V-fold PLP-dependent enzyme [Acidobacteriota bacterium]